MAIDLKDWAGAKPPTGQTLTGRCARLERLDAARHGHDLWQAVAGHDAVMAARVCPAAMLFVPSVGGISHNPAEYSTPEQVARGAQVLLDAVLALAG